MCGENLCNVFVILFMVLGVPIFEPLWRNALLMLWRAFLFLGLRPVRVFLLASFCLVVPDAFSCKNIWNMSLS
jgi:hypothetical protein